MPQTSAQTAAEKAAAREVHLSKIELEVDRRITLDTGLVQYHRLVLQALPFNGQPDYIADEHKAAMAALIEKRDRTGYRIRIKRIIGFASKLGDDFDNQALSQARVDAVHQFLINTINISGHSVDDMFANNFKKLAMGESDLPHPTNDEQDNPLNRRVEIIYILDITFPQPVGSFTQTSTMWKIDFSAAASASLPTPTKKSDFGITMQAGAGSLTMLPDGETGPSTPITRPMRFEQLGISIGLADKLKNLKFVTKIPGLRQVFKLLDSMSNTPYQKTSQVLQSVGFSVDIISSGGEFRTQYPVSFKDMQGFNFATISAGLSVLGKAEGALLLLHGEHFYDYTMIFGVGQDIAIPDASLQFIPAGFVQVNLDQGA